MTAQTIADMIKAAVAASRHKARVKNHATTTIKGWAPLYTLDAAQALYEREMQDPPSAFMVVVAQEILDKNAPALIQRFVQGDFKSTERVFAEVTGVKLQGLSAANKTTALYQWAGWTPEQVNAAREADAQQAAQRAANAAQALKRETLAHAWAALEQLRVGDPHGAPGAAQRTGQDFVRGKIAEGYAEVYTTKKGAATAYYLRKGDSLVRVKHKTMTAFLKAARDCDGLGEVYTTKKGAEAFLKAAWDYDGLETLDKRYV